MFRSLQLSVHAVVQHAQTAVTTTAAPAITGQPAKPDYVTAGC